MQNSREYKSNPFLITLLIIGSLAVVIEVLSYIFYSSRILFLELLFLIIIILSAPLVYKDAKKIDAGEAYPEQRTLRAMTWTPISWGILVFIIWVIFFPVYLFKREEIYWRNISVEYRTLKTIERDITLQTQRQPPPPAPNKTEYSENVGICPRCDTPYPLKMLERSKYCSRCGELLKKK
jgi:hypothetical protein